MFRLEKKENNTLLKQLLALLPVILFCILSVFYWEFITYRLTQNGLSGITPWVFVFVPAVGSVISAFSGLTYNRKANLYILGVFLFLLAAFYVADAIYFVTFGSLFSVSMMGMGGAALADFGWTILATVWDNIFSLAAYFLPPALLVIYVVVRKDGMIKIGAAARIISLGLGILFWVGAVFLLPVAGTADHTPYGAYHSQFVDTDTASKKIGALPNLIVEASSTVFARADSTEIESSEEVDLDGEEKEEEKVEYSANRISAINFGSLYELSDDSKIKAICKYLATERPTYQNEYTGLLEGYNVIFMCAEAFSSMAVREDVNPTLYKLANEGIVLTNYYNSFKNTTTNGEYAFLTGLWPDVSRDADMGTNVGSMAQSAKRYMPTALGNVMNSALGIQSYGFHNFRGSYYYRNESLPNFGFKCKFMNDGMEFSTVWPSSDLEMMEQSVDDYIYSEQPFVAYYMTFSGHGTYSTENPIVKKNLSYVKDVLGEESTLTDYAKGYLAAQYELDRALAYLLEKLEEAGKLDNTLIVISGDHYPYYLNEKNRNDLSGHEVETEFEMYKSTCIMWCGGLEENIVTDVPCCNVDIMPTVLNLLGIEYDSRLYSGVDIFSTAEHRAILYNRNFVTDKVMYNNSTGEAIWLTDTSSYSEEQLQSYLDSNITIVKSRYQTSVSMGDTDFFRFVYEESGLIDEE